MFKRVIGSRHLKTGIVEQSYFRRGSDDSRARRYFAAVRIGLNWPGVDQTGTFIVLGQQHNKDDPNDNTLEVLGEYELKVFSLDAFFNEMVSAYQLNGAEKIYCDFDEKACFESWRTYSANQNSNVNYTDLPYRSPFATAAMTKDLIKSNRLMLPKGSIVRQQAEGLEVDDVNDKLAKSYPMLQALFNVAGGFLKDPHRLPIRIPGARNLNPSPSGWMVM